jgi:hypothetical protein
MLFGLLSRDLKGLIKINFVNPNQPERKTFQKKCFSPVPGAVLLLVVFVVSKFGFCSII